MFNQWCTIESDPGVFTELVKKIGAPSVQVEEIYSMEEDQLITKYRPNVYGFIFLFKWTKKIQKRETLSIYPDQLFFARQTVQNACATQAILSVLLNSPISIEGDLKQFYQFAKGLSSEDRGLALSNSQAICKLHNSFSRPQPFIYKQDKNKRKKEADIYHFVSYVPHNGHLYQLDGLQQGPILLGKYGQQKSWVQLAKQQIQHRITKYSEKQIRFNLLMICQDLLQKVKKQIIKLQNEIISIKKRQQILGKQIELNEKQKQLYKQINASQIQTLQGLQIRKLQILIQIENRRQLQLNEENKAKIRYQQNIRRKHNYVPMIIHMLKILARNNKLNPLISNALDKQKEKSQQ